MIKVYSFYAFLFLIVIVSGCKKEDPVPPINQVPVANAGVNVTVTLPINSVNLTGTGIDVDGKIVAYLWSQISGPASSTIANPAAASTQINNLVEGTYVFQLMVTDNEGSTGVDTTTAFVSESPVKTLTLQPKNNPTEYQVEILNGQSVTQTRTEISIDAWTTSAQPWTLRDILKFDLSSIPTNATIKSANLYLYSNPTPLTGNLINANFGTSNSLILQEVTEDWSPSTITWFNQPSSSTTDKIIIPTTSQSTLDLNLDVKDMVSSMVVNSANYGFLIRLENEVTYNSRIFVSSYNTIYPEKHPTLIVIYQ